MPRGSFTKVALLAAVALSAGACEWFDTMSDPPDVQPHEREPWAPPQGSVPLDGDPEFTLADVEGLLSKPTSADSASVAIGEAYYRSFCSVCHGRTGLGDGPISGVFPAIPAIATPGVAAMSDGYLYALITQGRGLMPEYSRIPKRARWHVIDYMRTLGTGEQAPAAADTTATARGPAVGADTTAGGAQ